MTFIRPRRFIILSTIVLSSHIKPSQIDMQQGMVSQETLPLIQFSHKGPRMGFAQVRRLSTSQRRSRAGKEPEVAWSLRAILSRIFSRISEDFRVGITRARSKRILSSR